MSANRFRVGDTVRLRKGTVTTPPPYPTVRNQRTSPIALFYDDIEGGVRLEEWVGGFKSWNVADLCLVKRGSRAY